jgi:hypothetical protein
LGEPTIEERKTIHNPAQALYLATPRPQPVLTVSCNQKQKEPKSENGKY